MYGIRVLFKNRANGITVEGETQCFLQHVNLNNCFINQIMSKGKIAEFTEVPPSVFQGEPFKPKVDGTTLIPKFNPREMTPDDDIDYENGNSLASGPPAGHGMHAAGPPGSLAGSTEQLKSRQPREAVPFDNDTGLLINLTCLT